MPSMETKPYIRKIEAILAADYDHEIPDKPRSKAFNRAIKSMLAKMFPDAEILPTKSAWCSANGFIKFPNNVFIYYSFEDYRYADWKSRILVRTAKDERDYTGGANNFAYLQSLQDTVNWLRQRQEKFNGIQ